MNADLVHVSYGMGVPLYDYADERDQLQSWAEKKEQSGIEKYWKEKNHISLDSKPTNVLRNIKPQ